MGPNTKLTISHELETVFKKKRKIFWRKEQLSEIDLSLDKLLNGGTHYVKETTFFISLELTEQPLTIDMLNEEMGAILKDLTLKMCVIDAFYSEETLMFGTVMLSEVSSRQREVDRKLAWINLNRSIEAESELSVTNLYELYFYPHRKMALLASQLDYNKMGIDISDWTDFSIQLDLNGVPPSIIPPLPPVKEYGRLRLIKG